MNIQEESQTEDHSKCQFISVISYAYQQYI